jgi:hypothetical protein
VDGGDLSIWQQHYDPLGAGANTWGTGDWTGDGKVDGGDLALWQQHYDPVGSLPTTLLATRSAPAVMLSGAFASTPPALAASSASAVQLPARTVFFARAVRTPAKSPLQIPGRFPIILAEGFLSARHV